MGNKKLISGLVVEIRDMVGVGQRWENDLSLKKCQFGEIKDLFKSLTGTVHGADSDCDTASAGLTTV